MTSEKKPLKTFLYISVWVMIWGSIASLIDFPLLKQGIYLEGTIGQYITFSSTGFLSILIAKRFYKNFVS